MILVTGCSKGGGGGGECTAPPPPEPAFRLQVTTTAGAVPGGTRLEVTYQGSVTESFEVGKPSPGNVDVCCRIGRRVPDAGTLPEVSCVPGDGGTTDAGSPTDVLAIQCDLWTNGAAEIHIEAPGYPALDEVLNPKLREDGCGVTTADTRIVLERPDGGG